ncbi:MAG: OmpA family protein [Sedimentisphaerales bacterium]|nr:OmpA family protein [Sedimentisphaerales bacterium]
MQQKKLVMVAGMIAAIVVLGGCQPWQKKYEACNAELENLQALFDGGQDTVRQCEDERIRLAQQVQSLQQDLAAARTQATSRKKSGLEQVGGVYDAAKGTITITLANDVLFDSGKVTLKSQPKSKLNRISGIVQREHPRKEVWVVGHTDTDPIKKSGWKDNWQLSTERALAVTRYLLSQGIAAKQLAAVGRGEYHPVSGSKSQNRRVEIVVHTR